MNFIVKYLSNTTEDIKTSKEVIGDTLLKKQSATLQELYSDNSVYGGCQPRKTAPSSLLRVSQHYYRLEEQSSKLQEVELV